MLTEKEKDRLAELNGLGKERRIDEIRKRVKKKYRLEDEAAMARKMIKKLFDLVAALHGKEIADEETSEFMEYFNSVEAIKEEVDRK